MEPNTEKNQQAEAQETAQEIAQETAKTAEATAAEETTATESAEQPETAAAEAESTTEEDQHMKKKELKAALEKAEAALADHKDQHLRLMAEYQNYRNRTTEEKKKIYGDAKADCIKSLLTVVDTFERAMDAACSDETYKKGIEMTFSQLQKALEQMGVKEIAEVGVEFDPNLHNAIKQMDDTDFEENKVCQIYQKGYLLGDRLIRPAMVAVSV
ncbi:MAG: nucleotide exchange factor GrpE [Ruminococcus sp.]|nr:nucleotide exchange factor GrpE [Ruminococcus sp.]MDD6430661.1 nucleotide exchange factor GrpE [Ruminococcus sp.]